MTTVVNNTVEILLHATYNETACKYVVIIQPTSTLNFVMKFVLISLLLEMFNLSYCRCKCMHVQFSNHS